MKPISCVFRLFFIYLQHQKEKRNGVFDQDSFIDLFEEC